MKFAILEDNLPRLRTTMQKIRNRCKRFGCDFKYEEVGEEFRTIEDGHGNSYTTRYVIVEAEGLAKINGWRLIADIEHTDEGNIIHQICGIEVPEKYYTMGPVCEHCGTTRARKDTFILKNEETGEYKQVGKSCLKDFTNGISAENAAQYVAAFDELIECGKPQAGVGFQRYINTEEYMDYVAECIRHFGYVKNNPQKPEEISTKERAFRYYGADHAIYGKTKTDLYKKEMSDAGFDPHSPEAKSDVLEAMRWLALQEDSDNYMHNLKTACAMEWQNGRNLGTVASLFPTWKRAVKKEGKKEERANDTHAAQEGFAGEIDEKITVYAADTECVAEWENRYGKMHLYRFTDNDGNLYLWKTSTGISSAVCVIKGTVKDHITVEGKRYTELTRCKITG